MNFKNLKGKISIHRFSGNRSGICIEIEDETSHTRFLRLEMNAEDFGNAVTGASSRPCVFEIAPDNINKIHEHKRENVYFKPKSHKRDDAAAQKALEPFEVDGWTGRIDDLFNYHNIVGDDVRSVTFHRYVDKQPDDAPASFTK